MTLQKYTQLTSSSVSQSVVHGPEKLVVIPDNHYCEVKHPVVMVNGQPLRDPFGVVVLDHNVIEVRLKQASFPLYPGEIMVTVILFFCVCVYSLCCDKT